MINPDKLLKRLSEIGEALKNSSHALGLLALGSVGIELERLDAYSDLDFFVIVEEGYKEQYIERLDWLQEICPVAYCFPNTVDGYKLLFKDGIFCEFAVFTPSELSSITRAEGRIVWSKEGFDLSSFTSPLLSAIHKMDTEWLIGEILTNLYVGLCRYRRGETLSALRFIQSYAVDRVLVLISQLETPQAARRDPFSIERRFEFRYPKTSEILPKFLTGYGGIPRSVMAILQFLEEHFIVNPAMKQLIIELCRDTDLQE